MDNPFLSHQGRIASFGTQEDLDRHILAAKRYDLFRDPLEAYLVGVYYGDKQCILRHIDQSKIFPLISTAVFLRNKELLLWILENNGGNFPYFEKKWENFYLECGKLIYDTKFFKNLLQQRLERLGSDLNETDKELIRYFLIRIVVDMPEKFGEFIKNNGYFLLDWSYTLVSEICDKTIKRLRGRFYERCVKELPTFKESWTKEGYEQFQDYKNYCELIRRIFSHFSTREILSYRASRNIDARNAGSNQEESSNDDSSSEEEENIDTSQYHYNWVTWEMIENPQLRKILRAKKEMEKKLPLREEMLKRKIESLEKASSKGKPTPRYLLETIEETKENISKLRLLIQEHENRIQESLQDLYDRIEEKLVSVNFFDNITQGNVQFEIKLHEDVKVEDTHMRNQSSSSNRFD